MSDFTVAKRGMDTSSRDIYATNYMWSWWLAVCGRLGFTPTIVQGAFMTRAGGGADASAGYHDKGGCFDLREWDLSSEQVGKVIRELRRSGAAAWLRDEQHGGFSPHIHFVLGTDSPLASGAAGQWTDYLNGGDGIGGRDYHWRPDPIVTTPPEDEMADYAAQLDRIEQLVTTVRDHEDKRDAAERERTKKNHEAVLALLDKALDDIKDAASKAQVKRLREAVAALAAPEVEPTP
jgi:hypothetical protein